MSEWKPAYKKGDPYHDPKAIEQRWSDNHKAYLANLEKGRAEGVPQKHHAEQEHRKHSQHDVNHKMLSKMRAEGIKEHEHPYWEKK